MLTNNNDYASTLKNANHFQGLSIHTVNYTGYKRGIDQWVQSKKINMNEY